MGMMKGRYSSYGDYTPPNPDPQNFRVTSNILISKNPRYRMVTVKYPGCTTFEGQKILIYDNRDNDIYTVKTLDPHFTEGGKIIARFPATEIGRRDAIKFGRVLD